MSLTRQTYGNMTVDTCLRYLILFSFALQVGWGGGYDCLENIDECSATQNLCGPNSQCLDTDGSFECLCLNGFQLDANDACQGTQTHY